MERLIDILLLDYTQARRIGKYFLDKWKEIVTGKPKG
jgi:hypothetical protein